MDNHTISQRLREYANYLESQEMNVHRVRAYRRAAETVLTLNRPLDEIIEKEGRAGLEALPGIGPHLSFTLEGLVRTGEFRTLGTDGGRVDPERLLLSIPGVGPRLARQLHDELGVSTLEGLEMAAHDGRLARLGVGPKRLRGIIDSLAGRLGGSRRPGPMGREPSVADLLAIDAEYRGRAEQRLLPTLTPRRFNPDNQPWLPVYQTDRGDWFYRVLFSNTALAHRLNTTHDWVVVFFDDGTASGQRTVVTETRGDLRGRRVVRGRESECREHYGVSEERLRGSPQCGSAV
jgi:DNA polymerase (family X)